MEKSDASMRSKIKKSLEVYQILVGHWDLYIAFLARGHNILRDKVP